MKLLSEDHLYVDNMRAKFQGQETYPKKDIQNLPTSVTMRNNFKAANFNTLLRAKFLFLIMKFLA